MIVPVMVISNLVLTRQIYSEETNGAHAHYREPVPLSKVFLSKNMHLEHTKYCLTFTPRYSNDNTKYYSKQYIGG